MGALTRAPTIRCSAVVPRLLPLALPVLLVLAGCAGPGTVEDHVRTLASERLEGRLTGTKGERRAAAYLVRELRRIGAQPLGEGFEIPFGFAAGTRDVGSTLAVTTPEGSREFAAPDAVRALSFSASESVEAPVVFAGYGIVTPDAGPDRYDSYAGLDVRDKIVVVLRYFPEDLPHERRVALSRYSGLRYKALVARERGARGLVVLTGPRSPNAGQLAPLSFDTSAAGSGIVAASATEAVAQALFGGAGTPALAGLQARLDAGDPHAAGFALPHATLALHVRLERERREGRNVVGLLRGTDPGPRKTVLLGAHYDHLGRGDHGSSLAREDERGRIHPGADDNASGVAAVLAVGARLAADPPKGDVVLALWSGEELGLLGSTAFARGALLPPERIAAVLNFDMVGRAAEGGVVAQGTGTSPAWPALLERTSDAVGLSLAFEESPYLPTDSVVFDEEDVPTLNFFTGAHADYHRPTDTADRIDFAGLEQVARLGEAVARDLADAPSPPPFARVERHLEHGGVGRASLRCYTGTIPDYTATTDGLRLSGVVDGGPAEQAGLRGGDVIVRFGSQRIANIYDYTYALDAAKIGEPIEVEYLRGGRRRTTRLVPEARP